VIDLFTADNGRGHFNKTEHVRLDMAIVEECRRLAALPVS
jgi:hypothetical protein